MTRALFWVCLSLLAHPSLTRAWCQSTTDTTPPSSPTACNTEGLPLAWRQRCLSYSLDARGSRDLPLETVDEALARAFGRWQDVRCGDDRPTGLTFAPTERYALCLEPRHRRGGKNANVIAFVDDFEARMLVEQAYAVTIQWHSTSTGEILDVDMLVNERMGPYAVCPESGCEGDVVDLENVLTHEVGHFLGLSHSADEEATLYYEAARGETSKRTLAEDDIDGLCAIYPPGSLPEACSFTPRGGLSLDCESEGGGRCSVTARSENDGRVVLLGLVVLAGCGIWVRRWRRRAR